jgi:predicted alpha/beta-hydrolase family hydrolase
MSEREVETAYGKAIVRLLAVDDPRAALVLGHGAAGGTDAPDLTAVASAARVERLFVALVEQPYRVAGRRAPAPARQLDTAWTAVIDTLRRDELAGLSVVVGGRSAGARVACRTASATGAAGVLCLAFPLQPPSRSQSRPSRLPELDAVEAPTLVIQGCRDPFGVPPPGPRRTVVQVDGDHGLKADVDAVAAAAGQWLRTVTS